MYNWTDFKLDCIKIIMESLANLKLNVPIREAILYQNRYVADFV